MLKYLQRIFLELNANILLTNKRGIYMRKGTKTIRKVRTHNNEYYIYDLEEDIFGKRPRLYAKSEEEMLKKIEQAEEKRKSDLMKQTPKGKGLKEFVLFYFKNIVGSVPSVHIKRLMNLFENAVFGSSIDRDMDEITADEIKEFYDNLIDKYPIDRCSTFAFWIIVKNTNPTN